MAAVLIQRRVPPLIAGLIALHLAVSIAAVLDARLGGELYRHLALVPRDVWRGQIWRLVTWPFVMGSPLGLLFVCVAIYAFGWDLLTTWGERRLRRYLATVVLVAGAGTCVLSLALPGATWIGHLGGMALADALVIAWALQFPDRSVLMYFVLVLRGPAVAQLVVAVTLLFVVYYGVALFLPELLAIAVALLAMRPPDRRTWLRLEAWRLRRKLRVVRGGGSG